jgi:hypothetical protein
MIGTNRPSHQRFPGGAPTTPVVLLLALGLAACGGGGGSTPNLAPTIVSAAFAGATATPAAGDALLLFFSEDVTLVAGRLLTDTDLTLSGGASLGAVAAAPTLVNARSVSITLGTGVSIVPGTTTVALAAANDAVQDATSQLGNGGTAVTIATSDGVSPTLSNVTLNDIDDELNGTGPAGGTLQVPVNGFTIDLAYSDNGAIATSSTQITANVTVSTSAGAQIAGTNLRPFLTEVSATNTAAVYRVPTTVSFPQAAVTLTCQVIDATGLGSGTSTFSFVVQAFTDALRPFETTVNASQVWFLDFSRDVESFTTSAITNGVSVDVTNGANGTSDAEEILRVIGLLSTSPIPNVNGSQNSNAVVLDQYKAELLAQLASLYSGANVTFTLTQPSGSFGTSSSLAYNAIGYSQICVAGASLTTGVLGIAIFDPANVTQNNNCQTDFQGQRLGVFLHTIADFGMGPPAGSTFRNTFDPLASSLGGTPVGDDAQDGQRLMGTLNDSRATVIAAAIAEFARCTAVVVAHECGHSVGLVKDGAMPTGLYGGDLTNFVGSSSGHIRNASLFPAGSTNVMSPSLSYPNAINASTAFNTLNLAYLREQAFYDN